MISIIIPSFNEEKRLKESLPKLKEFLETFESEYEVIIVDDASSDQTAEVANGFKNQIKNLKVLSLPKNLGKGGAVKAGFNESQGDIVVFTDADFSTPITEIHKLLEKLNTGYDIAIGSRAIDRSVVKKHQNFFRELMGRTFNLFVQALVIKGISDTQCGFKAFKKTACQEIFNKQTLNNFSFDVELLFLAQRAGLKIAEVPVLWFNSTESKVNPITDSLTSFFDLLRIRLRHASKKRGFIDKAIFVYQRKTFWRFALVGLSGTIIDYTLYFFLTRFFNLKPLTANPISVEAAILWNFTLNNLWTFARRDEQKSLWKKLITFQIVSFGGLLLSQIQILIFTHFFGIYDLISKALTIPLVAIFNYYINSRWTFREKTKTQGYSFYYLGVILLLFVVYLILSKEVDQSFLFQ